MTAAGGAAAEAGTEIDEHRSDTASTMPTDSRPGPVAGAGPGRGPVRIPMCTAGCISSQAGLATFRL